MKVMTSGNSLVRTMCHLNKLLRTGRTHKLYQPNLIPFLSPASTMCSSAKCEEAYIEPDQKVLTKKDNTELEKLLVEKDKMLEDSRKEASGFKVRYYRLLAEGENFRRRGISDAKFNAVQGLAKDLLELADKLEIAKDYVPHEEWKKNKDLELLNALAMKTEREIQEVFKKHGLQKVNRTHVPFDPNFHKSVDPFQTESESLGTTIAIVKKVGYKLHGRALRKAKVVVAS